MQWRYIIFTSLEVIPKVAIKEQSDDKRRVDMGDSFIHLYRIKKKHHTNKPKDSSLETLLFDHHFRVPKIPNEFVNCAREVKGVVP